MIATGSDGNLPSQTSLLEKPCRFWVTSNSNKMRARGPDNLSELTGAGQGQLDPKSGQTDALKHSFHECLGGLQSSKSQLGSQPAVALQRCSARDASSTQCLGLGSTQQATKPASMGTSGMLARKGKCTAGAESWSN